MGRLRMLCSEYLKSFLIRCKTTKSQQQLFQCFLVVNSILIVIALIISVVKQNNQTLDHLSILCDLYRRWLMFDQLLNCFDSALHIRIEVYLRYVLLNADNSLENYNNTHLV